MRMIEEIKADIEKCKSRLLSEALSDYQRYSLEDSIKSYEQKLRIALTDGIPLSRLEELCQAERENRCVVLPCKVGDTVFVLMQRNTTTEVVKGTVRNVRRYSDNAWWLEFSDLWVDKTFDDFGKTVFLTKEEAEHALKGEGNE